jgi:hypothetical protein
MRRWRTRNGRVLRRGRPVVAVIPNILYNQHSRNTNTRRQRPDIRSTHEVEWARDHHQPWTSSRRCRPSCWPWCWPWCCFRSRRARRWRWSSAGRRYGGQVERCPWCSAWRPAATCGRSGRGRRRRLVAASEVAYLVLGWGRGRPPGARCPRLAGGVARGAVAGHSGGADADAGGGRRSARACWCSWSTRGPPSSCSRSVRSSCRWTVRCSRRRRCWACCRSVWRRASTSPWPPTAGGGQRDRARRPRASGRDLQSLSPLSAWWSG